MLGEVDFSSPKGAEGLSERSVYVYVYRRVYVQLVLAIHFEGDNYLVYRYINLYARLTISLKGEVVSRRTHTHTYTPLTYLLHT